MHPFASLLSQSSTLAMAGVCLCALLRGAAPERAMAVALAVNWIGSAIGQDRRPGHHGQPIVMALDLGLLVFALTLTASCRRTWLLWASACCLLLVLTHVATLLDGSFGQWSYMTAYYVWSLGLLTALAVGALAEGRRPVRWLIRFT